MKQQERRLTVDQPLSCHIRAAGEVAASAVASWADLRVSPETSHDGVVESLVRGRLADQAALIGVVNHLYNLGFVILSVECNELGAESPGFGR